MFVFFLLTGRWLELRLRDRTAGALEAVLNRLPDSVERLGADGAFTRVAVRRLVVGDTVRCLPGEAFPADGTILKGSTQADEALLTGESTPAQARRQRGNGWQLQPAVVGRSSRGMCGRPNPLCTDRGLDGERWPAKATPGPAGGPHRQTVLVAVLLAAFAAAAWWWPKDPGHALMVAVAVLIVTCPCALSLATPVAMLTAAGTLARQGVLVRNLQGLEALAEIDTVVFDKRARSPAMRWHCTRCGWRVAIWIGQVPCRRPPRWRGSPCTRHRVPWWKLLARTMVVGWFPIWKSRQGSV